MPAGSRRLVRRAVGRERRARGEVGVVASSLSSRSSASSAIGSSSSSGPSPTSSTRKRRRRAHGAPERARRVGTSSSAVAYSSGSASANSAQSDHSTTTPSSASRSAEALLERIPVVARPLRQRNACSQRGGRRPSWSSTSLPSRTTRRRTKADHGILEHDGATAYVQAGDASRGGEVVRPGQSHGAMTSRSSGVVVAVPERRAVGAGHDPARPCSCGPGCGHGVLLVGAALAPGLLGRAFFPILEHDAVVRVRVRPAILDQLQGRHRLRRRRTVAGRPFRPWWRSRRAPRPWGLDGPPPSGCCGRQRSARARRSRTPQPASSTAASAGDDTQAPAAHSLPDRAILSC